MSFDKNCKYHKSCGYDLCHGEGVCKEFESYVIPKPKPKRKSSRNPTPQELLDQVYERDGGMCQDCGVYCGYSIPHHIIHGGTGRKRIHRIENLITLCQYHHEKAHSSRDYREWTYTWSRQKYGDKVDKLLQDKWSDKKG